MDEEEEYDMMAEQPGPLSRLARQDWWCRKKAISELAADPLEDYLPYLEEGIRNHENADVRNAAMEVYRELGPRAFPSLTCLLKDADPEVRLFAVNILSEIAEKKSLPLLFFAIRDKDVNVRAAAAEAMGRIGDRSAIKPLGDVLDDEPWVAMAAIHAAGEIGGEEALDLLHECLGREEYREIAIAAVEKAGNRRSIRYLTSCFDGSGPATPALKAIVKIAEREDVRPQPEYFIGLVPALVEMIESPDTEIKEPALTALCWSGDIMALPCFIEAMRDEKLQEYAIEGLLGIGRRAVCGIVDEMKACSGRHRPLLAKVLSMIGEDSALLQFADDEDPAVRTEAALALGALHLKRAEQTLSRMLCDPDREVRAAAKKSLALLNKESSAQ
jgi:HEAT repeat protein